MPNIMNNGVSIFIATATLLTSFVIHRMKVKAAMTSRANIYRQMLGKLFQPASKVISRHDNKVLSTEEAFELRKNFFSTLYQSNNLQHSCKVIHVAGTKGKGSTVEYISSALTASNAKVGVFTSPHLHTARERIKVDKDLISIEKMVEYANKAVEALKNSDQSVWAVFFDYFLMMAIQHFGEQKVNYIVLECGIGGRYDSTNFIDAPSACIITSISLDHQSVLGETIEEIAWQKAGIIKRNSHVFTPNTQLPSVIEVFKDQCEKLNARLHVVPVSR